MIILLNLTTTKKIEELTYYDDNKDIIWPTIVGIFVALALGWIICRYKCSSQERSPHIVQCCPKSCCTRIRLCCICMFSLCRFKNVSEQPTSPDSRIQMNKRSSNHSILEIPFITNNRRLSLTYANQLSSPPFSIPTTTINSSQPKRHPLRRESLISTTDNNNNTGRRDSASWPLQPTTMVFHKQTNEIKKSSVFFNI